MSGGCIACDVVEVGLDRGVIIPTCFALSSIACLSCQITAVDSLLARFLFEKFLHLNRS
jgi:hypothetical protein